MCEQGLSSSDPAMESSLKVLTSLAKRPEVDIAFQDLTYTVRGEKKDTQKEILHGLSGSFETGKLTAILGPSGAGKSSLMNILVGYNSIGVKGIINVNGKPRDIRLFHKVSCYIMQDDLMHSGLTLEEAMNVAAELKLGNELKSQDKLLVIEEILTVLGLESCRNVRSEKLSGGQRKRLAIALELVNNPTVIFLDEPTTGLDIVSMTHCLKLLKHLAHYGRTIVCTIHQPSATVLSLFDNVYILGRGKCVYQGHPQQLVSFMKRLNFECPISHNPADFILETLQTEEHINILSAGIENGKHYININTDEAQDERNIKKVKNYDKSMMAFNTKTVFASPYYTQVMVLLKRMLLQKKRNIVALIILILHHILTAFVYGAIFYNVGNDGTAASANFNFCMSILVFFAYSYVMIPVLLFPTELKILRREYFNRWYGLKAYWTALSIANVPLLVILGMIFLGLTYFLSGQILEFERFFLFCLISILTGYCSEGLGLIVGSAFNVQNGSIVVFAIASPLMGLCFYGMGFGPYIEPHMRILMGLSYMRFAIDGISVAIYDMRSPLNCEGMIYCHYRDPKVLLRDFGMQGASYGYKLMGLLIYTLLFRLAGYAILRIRLQREFSNKFLSRASHYLRRK